MKKHPDADVMVSFASLRSAYESTLEALNFEQVLFLLDSSGVYQIRFGLSLSANFTTKAAFVAILAVPIDQTVRSTNLIIMHNEQSEFSSLILILDCLRNRD